MLKGSSNEGLLSHEILSAVQFHQRIKRPVNLLLKEDRVVALIPPPQFRLDFLRKVRGSHEPPVGALGLIVDLADPGAHSLLVNEFDRRQEIIQEGTPGAVDSGEGLVLGGGVEAVVADILPDAGEIFLFDEAVVVFLVGSATGKGDVMGIASGQEGTVDKFRAVVAVDAEEGEGESGMDVREGLQDPFLGFIEEGAEFDPAGRDVGGVQGQTKLPGIPFAAVMDRIDLEKPRFSLVPGVMGTDGDMFFQEFSRFGATYAPGRELFPVVFQGPVNSGEAYRTELVPDSRGNTECGPCLKEGHLFPDKGG
jgi:hypothetical protein